ncbi:dihydroorotase [Terasakiella pusilla]|uniref:dihydroorotase n=1 Tax=Terasakiella pusilla TaxID=64973 RepID=UPI00048FF38B|nr:amidohydrolase family protein [Terasakiella pusilla]
MLAECELVLIGKVVLTDRVIEDGYVALIGGRIVAIGSGDAPKAKQTINYKNDYILPGAIDAQVHSRSQKDQEGFAWSTRSAAAGGVTTIVDMPYDDGDLICNAERLSLKAEEAKRECRVDFALYGTCHPEEGAAKVQEMVEAGACSFKFSTFGTHPERFPRIPPHTMYECFAEIAKFGLAAGVHNENHEMVTHMSGQIQAQGITDYTAHGLSRPAITETLAMAEIYEIGAATGCSAHVVHCSVGRGYDMCAAYRQQGFDTTIEACVHYLTLNEEDHVAKLGGKAKINPPIRPKAEVEKLWAHLAAGNVTLVSTDHVSWSENRKTDPNMLKNSSGVPGLEVLYGLLLKGLHERGLPFTWAARLLAKNPAEHFRLSHRKGAIEIGKDADIVVMRHAPYRYKAGESGHNVVDWSPYEGMELPYRPVATYVRGELVFKDGDVIAEPGNGDYITPLTAKIEKA